MKQFLDGLVSLFVLLAGVAVGQAQFSVGSASAAAGEKATGFIECQPAWTRQLLFQWR